MSIPEPGNTFFLKKFYKSHNINVLQTYLYKSSLSLLFGTFFVISASREHLRSKELVCPASPEDLVPGFAGFRFTKTSGGCSLGRVIGVCPPRRDVGVADERPYRCVAFTSRHDHWQDEILTRVRDVQKSGAYSLLLTFLLTTKSKGSV